MLRLDGSMAFLEPLHAWMTQVEAVAVVRRAVNVLRSHNGGICFAEKVGVMPKDGRKGANTFGRIDGILRGAVLMAEVVISDVPPVIWQSRLECLSGGNKNVTKRRAIELFPDLGKKITHNTADALLIAEYGRRWLVR